MSEAEFGRNLFYFFIGELGSILLAFLLKEDRRVMVFVLVIGSIISGYMGFGRQTAEINASIPEISQSSEATLENVYSLPDEQDPPTQIIVIHECDCYWRWKCHQLF